MGEKMDKALEAMKIEVEKWKYCLRESTKGQDEAYCRQVADAIAVVEGSFMLLDLVDERNAWIKSSITFTITAVCGGEVFTKQAGNVISGLSRGKQVIVFEDANEMAALMGRAGGRG